ncbi:MAG: hypothetical protein AB7G17_05715 [Phycisphaerales bacterium]
MAEKAPKPEKDATKADAGAEGGEKKKLPIKALAVVGVIVLLEAVAVIGVAMRSGPSKASAADAAHAEGDHGAAKDDGHGAKKDDGHGAKKDDGHAAKKDDGHGAKKDDGHGAKKDDGHGAKKDSGGHGGGDKPEGPALGPEDIAETLVVKDKFPNNQTGRAWLWDVEVYVQVRNKRLDLVTATLTTRSAEVKTGIARIWRTGQHAYFNEPGLETLTRQVREFLNGIVGQGADGQPMIERVLIPRCVGFPTEF